MISQRYDCIAISFFADEAAKWKAAMKSKGAVLYSSQWVGWVPGDCGGGDLGSSVFAVKNLKITGRVVQGPEPRRCHPVTTPAPSPSSSCSGSSMQECVHACP